MQGDSTVNKKSELDIMAADSDPPIICTTEPWEHIDTVNADLQQIGR